MTPRALFLTLLLTSAASPQDSTLILLSNTVSICRGDDSGAPGCVTPPRLTYAPEPKYPKDERKASHPGTVILALGIGPDGLPRGNTVSRPLSSEFDEPASDAVKKWKFSPAIRDGKAVATNVNAEESFRLY